MIEYYIYYPTLPLILRIYKPDYERVVLISIGPVKQKFLA